MHVITVIMTLVHIGVTEIDQYGTYSWEDTSTSEEIHPELTRCYTESSNFFRIVRTPCFVDKTKFIKKFVAKRSIIQITAPSKFGKSTNINMLKRFLSKEVSASSGRQRETGVSRSGRRKKNMLTKNCKYFKNCNLTVYQDQTFFVKHCGRYPVVFLDLKFVSGDNFQQVLRSFRVVLHNTFREHSYLVKSTYFGIDWSSKKLFRYNLNTFVKYWDKDKFRDLKVIELIVGLRWLTSVLHANFKQNVTVLIDNYDTPVFHALHNSYSDVREIVMFFRKIICNLFKENYVVSMALINAGSRITEILSCDAQNIVHIHFAQDRIFAKYFGFTTKEVRRLLQKNHSLNNLGKIRNWYSGYHVANMCSKIYNPWSIVNYLNEKKFKIYSVDSSFVEILEEVFNVKEIRKEIKKILDGNRITVKIQNRVSMKHLDALKELIKCPHLYGLLRRHSSLFFQLLRDNGYLTVLKNGTDKNSIQLQIPNDEIKSHLEDLLNRNKGYVANQ